MNVGTRISDSAYINFDHSTIWVMAEFNYLIFHYNIFKCEILCFIIKLIRYYIFELYRIIENETLDHDSTSFGNEHIVAFYEIY